MKTTTMQELSNYARNKLLTIEDTAIFLNLFYPNEVDEFVESYTLDYTDLEMITEIINQLNLPITRVSDDETDDIKFLCEVRT